MRDEAEMFGDLRLRHDPGVEPCVGVAGIGDAAVGLERGE
jgi:hypothetical protein